MGRPLDLIFPVLLAVLPIYLIMNQPDLGTSLKLMACLSVILFLAGLRWWLVLAGLGAGIAGAYWFIDRCLQSGIDNAGYQCRRVLVLFDPELDLSGAGYHIHQAKIAIGSGGIARAGLRPGPAQPAGLHPREQHRLRLGAAG